MSKKELIIGFVLFLGLSAAVTLAGTISKSYTFSSGQTASSGAVNSNFDQLFSEINSKETRIAALEAAPVTASFMADEMAAVSGTVSFGTDSNQMYGFYIQDPAPADGNAFQGHFSLKAGTYTLKILGATWTNRGLIDWYIDGSLVAAGQDWYSAGLVYNVTKTIPVTLTSGGDHVLKGVINGKNGASSNYYYTMTKFFFY